MVVELFYDPHNIQCQIFSDKSYIMAKTIFFTQNFVISDKTALSVITEPLMSHSYSNSKMTDLKGKSYTNLLLMSG